MTRLMTQLIADVWRDVLGIAALEPTDDFFDLGGHSLTAVKIVSRLEAEYDVELPVTLVFEYPVFAQFAEVIDEMLRDVQTSDR